MLIKLKNIEARKSDGSYLDLYENIYNFDVFDFISDISIDNMRIDRNDSNTDFIADKIKIKYDRKKPNGTPRKVMNVDLARKYGWSSKINFNEGILKTYNSYIKST